MPDNNLMELNWIVYCQCTRDDVDHRGTHPFALDVCGELSDVHIIPLNDKIIHSPVVECECQPQLDHDNIRIHNALDGRQKPLWN